MQKKSLKKQAEEIKNKLLDQMTYDIVFEIQRTYENIINQFYNDYLPKYYNRTYSLFLASNASKDINTGIRKTLNGYSLGISISSDNIEGKPYRGTTEWVFHRSFVDGIHGFSENDNWTKKYSKTPPLSSPSPKEQMDEWFNNFKKDKKQLQKIKQNAIRKAFGK